MTLSKGTGWPTAPLRDLIAAGDKINYGVVQPGPEVETGVPLIRVADIVDGRLHRTSFRKIEEEVDAQYSRSRLIGDEVLLACVGSIGAVALAHHELAGCNIARAVARIRCGPRLDRRFLYWYLQSDAPQSYFVTETRAVAQPTLNITQIEALAIPLPPLAEQRRIADILDKADAIRRKRKEAITLTEKLLRSAFLEMFGDPATNPKGWKTAPLDALVDHERGISYGVVQRGPEVDHGVPVVRISNFTNNRFDGTDVVRTALEISNAYRRTILQGGELVVSIRGTVGRTAIVPNSAKGWNVSREVAVVPLRQGVSATLVQRALLTDGLQRFILGNVKGVAQSGINLADLRLAPIPLPAKEHITRFEKFVQTVAQVENDLFASMLLFDKLFSSLVDRAFRGELGSAPATSPPTSTPTSTSSKKQLDLFDKKR